MNIFYGGYNSSRSTRSTKSRFKSEWVPGNVSLLASEVGELLLITIMEVADRRSIISWWLYDVDRLKSYHSKEENPKIIDIEKHFQSYIKRLCMQWNKTSQTFIIIIREIDSNIELYQLEIFSRPKQREIFLTLRMFFIFCWLWLIFKVFLFFITLRS